MSHRSLRFGRILRPLRLARTSNCDLFLTSSSANLVGGHLSLTGRHIWTIERLLGKLRRKYLSHQHELRDTDILLSYHLSSLFRIFATLLDDARAHENQYLGPRKHHR